MYVVRIHLKSGYLRYLRVRGHDYPKFSLVRTKSQATKTSDRYMAALISEYFWEHHWAHAEYESRSIEEIRTRGPNKPKEK